MSLKSISRRTGTLFSHTAVFGFSLLLFGLHSVAKANEFTSEQIDFFEKQIRPILAEQCYDCHGAHHSENGLRLDSRQLILRGSDYSKVVEPGNVKGSKLLKSLRHEPGVEAMPKKADKLTDAQIAAFEKWVAEGLPWPKEAPVAELREAWRDHWSFLPVTQPELPKVEKLQSEVKTPVDRFLAAKLEAKGLNFAPPADPEALLRRVYLNLTGLLPSFEQAQEFRKDPSSEAFSRIVDGLLASPTYGERWGRHWLDVARYSDTKGYLAGNVDIRYPHAYTYRDWVIKAFNDDMPYDQFVKLQLAADKIHGLPKEGETGHPHLAALGLLTVGDLFINDRLLQNDDRIDVVTRGFMGLTVSCARCHDHKYDPVSAKDYYSLYSIFNSSEQPAEFPRIGLAQDAKARETFDSEVAKIRAEQLKFNTGIYQDLANADRVKLYLDYAKVGASYEGGQFRAEAAKLNIRDRAAQRFLNFTKFNTQKDPAHPVLAIWKAYVGLKDADYASQSEAIKAKLLAEPKKVQALLLEEFKKRPAPKNFAEVTQFLAEIFAKAGTATEPLEGAWADLQHQLKRMPHSPYEFGIPQMNQFYTTRDRQEYTRMENQVQKLEIDSPGAPQRAMVMVDREKPADVRVMIRGNPGRQGDVAPRAFLSALGGQTFKDGSGRLEFAEAMVDRSNPFTARVIVNRVWMSHFGQALVGNTSDFGTQTPEPEQRELLDYLSNQLMENGWSLKKLHRLILTSRAYQQSTESTPEKTLKDPENHLLSRFLRQRVDYETLRDTTLQVSADLNVSDRGGRSVPLTSATVDTRRSVYLFVDRFMQPTVPAMFDFANPDSHSPQRFNTTVPQQTLFLMNSPYMKKRADKVASEPQKAPALDQQIREVYRKVLLRDPKPEEAALANDFLTQAPELFINPYGWEYGHLSFSKKDGAYHIGDFSRFKHLITKDKQRTWAPDQKVPHPQYGFLFWSAGGLHPGNGDDAVALRWTVPFDGSYRLAGDLKHGNANGNGIRAVILVDGQRVLVDKRVHNRTEAMGKTVELKKGQKLTFLVSGEGASSYDGSNYHPQIFLQRPGQPDELITHSQRDFCGHDGWPLNLEKPQKPLSQLAQVLLMSNEFQFID